MTITNSPSSVSSEQENFSSLVSRDSDTHFSATPSAGTASASASAMDFQEIDLSNAAHLSGASSSSSLSSAIEGTGSQFSRITLMEPKKKIHLPISRPPSRSSSRPLSRPPTPSEPTSAPVSAASAKAPSRPPSPFIKGEPRKPIPMNPDWKHLYKGYEHTPETQPISEKDPSAKTDPGANLPRKPQKMNPAYKGYARTDGRPADEQDKVIHHPLPGSSKDWTKAYYTFESASSSSLSVDTSSVVSPKNYPSYTAPEFTPTSGSAVQSLVDQYNQMGSPRNYPLYVAPQFSPSFAVSVNQLLSNFESTSESSSSAASSLAPATSSLTPKSNAPKPLLVSPAQSPTNSASTTPKSTPLKQPAASPAASPFNGAVSVKDRILQIESPRASTTASTPKASPVLAADPV